MFELHITCTKDIDKLSIDFSDGTSIVQESKPKEIQTDNKLSDKDINKDILFANEKFYNKQCKNDEGNEVIRPIDLPDIDRPANVDNTLHNLEF